MFNIFKREKLVEVCRSFSYKLNMGNYESRDFFCSQKTTVPEKNAEKASEALYEFVKSEVIKSVNNYKVERVKPKMPQKEEDRAKSDLERENAESEIKGRKVREGKEHFDHRVEESNL